MADLKKANFWKTCSKNCWKNCYNLCKFKWKIWCLHNLQEQCSYENKIFNIINKLILYFKSLE